MGFETEQTQRRRVLQLAREGRCSVARLLLLAKTWRRPLDAETRALVLQKADFTDLQFYAHYWQECLDRRFWDSWLDKIGPALDDDSPVRIDSSRDVLLRIVAHTWIVRNPGRRWSRLERAMLRKEPAMGAIRSYLDALGPGKWAEGEAQQLCDAL